MHASTGSGGNAPRRRRTTSPFRGTASYLGGYRSTGDTLAKVRGNRANKRAAVKARNVKRHRAASKR